MIYIIQQEAIFRNSTPYILLMKNHNPQLYGNS